jgi:hypothetical protein
MSLSGTDSRPQWACYAASGWAFLFAAMSFYWALGGTRGAATLGLWAEQAARNREPEMVFTLWVTGLLKAVLGLLPLSVLQGWFPSLSQRLLRPAMSWIGASIVLYYLASSVQGLLMLGGMVPMSKSLGRTGVVWHLMLWNPWWIFGGTLFIIAARLLRSKKE